MRSLFVDLRYSFRILLQSPSTTAIVVLSLALGIGANATIFSVLNAVLLGPYPVKDPDRLMVLQERNLQQDRSRIPTHNSFEEWKRQSRVFESLAQIDIFGAPATLTGADKQAVRIQLSGAGTDLFSVLGVAPALGRAFVPEDSPSGDGHAAILSYGFWQRHFGGDPKVIGQIVVVDSHQFTIVGVMPPGFWFLPRLKDTDVWYPVNSNVDPEIRYLMPVGRLKPGVTMAQAQAEADLLFQRVFQQQPHVNKGWSLRVEGLQDWAATRSRGSLYLLSGAVGFVLLIACANVANLLLARASGRRREFAVRAAIGASGFRLLRQLLTESLALALVSGVVGILVVWWAIPLFVMLAPPEFGNIDIRIDPVVLGFLLVISALTGLLFGAMPALEAFRQDPGEWLKQTGGRFAGRARSHGRNVLVIGEIALAMVLLTGAGLMINSFLRIRGVELGFNPHNVLKAEIFLGGTKYWNSIGRDLKRVTPESDLFFERLLERVQQFPGILSAGIGAMESYYPRAFLIVGRTAPAPEDRFRADYLEVSPGYFRTLEIPLLRGRLISEDDREQSPWVAVVSEAFARRYFPGENAVGKLIQMSASRRGASRSIEESRPREIVGVVGDVWYAGPRSERPLVVYGSYRQHVWDYPAGSYASHLANRLVVRTAGPPGGFALAVQRAVTELDKDQVPFDIAPLERTIAEFGKPQRFWLQLFGIFGGLALFMAVVGIYGVMSHTISRRTHEIGVRVVSGAQRSDILKLVAGHGCILASIGVAIGTAGSLGLTRLVEMFLYDVKATDPLTFVVVTLVLLTVALGACYIPARRATRIEPLSALRHE